MSLHDEVRQFCRTAMVRLNTDLGQHFLVDGSILKHIVETAKITPEDNIVEIGPGIGVLTRELLKAGAGRVTAVELDPRMIPLLEVFLAQDESIRSRRARLTVIRANALEVPLPETPYKIVANIPYQITSPLLRHAFLESAVTPTSLTLLIQREVAEKICDAKDAGILTILVALFGTPRIIAHVPPDAFLPPPAVDSAVIHIQSHPQPLTDRATIDRVFSMTKLAFGGKRKMLRNTFGTLPDGHERLARAGIDGTRRPQTLSVAEWIALAKDL